MEKHNSKPYSLAVKAIIFNRSSQCLLLRRSDVNRHFEGCWEWPGGKVEPGESFDHALMRETKEETGLDIEITGLAGATSFEMSICHVVLICMETRSDDGKIRLSAEHDAYEWVDPAAMRNYKLPEAVGQFMIKYAEKINN